MVGVADLVFVTVRNAWIAKACDYAQISLVWTFNRMRTSDYCRRLRRIVTGLVAEYAYLDWLNKQGMPVGLRGRTAWYEKDRWDIDVKSVPNDVKSLFVDSFPQNLHAILDWCVLVPVDQVASKSREGNQIVYVFAFVSGKWFDPSSQSAAVPSIEDVGYSPSTSVSFPRWLVHIPWDFDFTKRKIGNLGRLVVQTNDKRDYGAQAELGGTVIAGTGKRLKRQIVRERVMLGPSGVKTQTDFFELLYVRWLSPNFPQGIIEINATALPVREVIPPNYGFVPSPRRSPQLGPILNGWYDIWLYDAKVLLAGWADIKTVKEWQILRHFKPCPPVRATQTQNYFNHVRNIDSMLYLLKDC